MKTAVVALAAFATLFTGAVSAQAASMVEYGAGDAKGEFNTQLICYSFGEIPHGKATPKINMSVRLYPRLNSPTCGNVAGGHKYESACWRTGEGNKPWLIVRGDQGRWGYVPLSNVYPGSFPKCNP